MRVPRSVARFNRRITNPAALRVVGRMPILGILEHVGRKTGKRYRTPLLVFDTRDGYAILVGYGPQTHWLLNVLAGGPTRIRKHGVTIPVVQPVLLEKREMTARITTSTRWLYRLFPYNEAVLALMRADFERSPNP